jgi:hypothetical protein
MKKQALLGAIVVLLMIAGTVSAQWWNPLESDCAKSARLVAEVRCEDKKWRESRRQYESEEECYADYYFKAMNICKDK